jgi:hypothetical protein
MLEWFSVSALYVVVDASGKTAASHYGALTVRPMQAGLVDRLWTFEDLLEAVTEQERERVSMARYKRPRLRAGTFWSRGYTNNPGRPHRGWSGLLQFGSGSV